MKDLLRLAWKTTWYTSNTIAWIVNILGVVVYLNYMISEYLTRSVPIPCFSYSVIDGILVSIVLMYALCPQRLSGIACLCVLLLSECIHIFVVYPIVADNANPFTQSMTPFTYLICILHALIVLEFIHTLKTCKVHRTKII